MFIDIIAAARPNFMKIAPIIDAIRVRNHIGKEIFDFRLVHTGQHYDENMSSSFFKQLNIPQPHINLEVGSGSQAEIAAEIMIRYERVLIDSPPVLVLVVGDVTSTTACAITAQKLGIPVAHVEAGIRSGDWKMPEEINRLVTDSITNWFFTTSEFANRCLIDSGVSPTRIFFVGNTMIDTLLKNTKHFCRPKFWNEHQLHKKNYFVLTLHRPSNVDHSNVLSDLLRSISSLKRDLPVVFPVHPRTSKILHQFPELLRNFILVEPQPYFEFNYLVQNAKAVITDSGGITEEATVMGIPCLTLRDTTERPETVSCGTNVLVGTSHSAMADAFDTLFSGLWKKGAIPKLWDGHAGERIVNVLERILISTDYVKSE